jgi:hypothetical protein
MRLGKGLMESGVYTWKSRQIHDCITDRRTDLKFGPKSDRATARMVEVLPVPARGGESMKIPFSSHGTRDIPDDSICYAAFTYSSFHGDVCKDCTTPHLVGRRREGAAECRS